MKRSTRFRLSAGSFAVGLALAATPAIAQDVDENEALTVSDFDEMTDDDAIVVTGTRIRVNPNLEGAAPVLTVDAEEITARGTVRIEDLTNQLPQVFAGQAGEVSNGASGTATLNLRGLGAVRTLVLIDGRRLPYGSSVISAPNLDLVPTQLVERVDILTGGASAVYGSDAIGGVANFILKDDFEGVELDVQGGFAQTGNDIDFFENVLRAGNQPIPDAVIDGEEYTITGIIGTNTADGRGNVTVYAQYDKRRAITQDDRVFSACAIGGSDGDTSFGGAGCVGSANFRLFGNEVFAFQQEDGTLTEFQGGPAETFNFGPFNFFQRPNERYTIYAKGQYELTDNLEVFLDASYVDNSSDAQIAPSASFGFGAYSINCDNPLIADNDGVSFYDVFGCSEEDIEEGNDVSGITASHRNVEGGPRNSRLDNSAFRIVTGLRGDFADAVWAYEVFGQYAETSDQSTSTNDFIVANLQQAFFAVEDEDGNIVCRDQSGGCVPYNIFQRGPNGESLVTQEALDFLQGVGIIIGETSQLVAGANVQADLGDYGLASPFGEDGIAFVAGVEYREDTLDRTPDEISQVPGGGFTGVGGATLPVSGSVEVYEAYTELLVPLVQDRPFFRELTLSGQYRYSDYTAEGNMTTNSFSTDAYGASLTWKPVDSLTLRGQYQRAVRAPNVIELYTGQDVGLPNLNQDSDTGLFDPCATANPSASFEQCARTGVTQAQYGNIVDVISGQTQGITGGNPELDPEVSDTFTAGAVFQPNFDPNLIISVDYFDITVEDYIAAGIGAQTILDNCLETGDAAFCDLLTRDASGSLNSGTPGVGFLLTNINIAELTTSGIDAQVNYRLGLGTSDLVFDYAGTYLISNDFIPFPGGDPIDCAGFLNNDCVVAVNPEYRHRALVTWESPFDFDATLTWRHFGGTNNEPSESSPEIDNNFPARNFMDIAVFYDFNEAVTLRGGILNFLNETPPISASSGPPLGNGNTYPTVYDTGRQFFAGLNVRF